jgi:hypothetical protein
MKKLLVIIFLVLFWGNSAHANHYGLTKNCYIKKISDPKLKSYERNSFSEMKNFPSIKDFFKYEKFYLTSIILKQKKIVEYKSIELSSSDVLTVVTEDEDGSIDIQKAEYKIVANTADYIKAQSKSIYGPIIIDKKKRTIEFKTSARTWYGSGTRSILHPNTSFSIFLQCKYDPYKHRKNKKNINKNKGSYDFYLILLGILGLINLAGLVYLIRRKK